MTWTEAEFERWLFERDEQAGHGRIWGVLNRCGLWPPGSGATAYRQVHNAAGIADIVIVGAGPIMVIELKACHADGNALAQVLSYKAALCNDLDVDPSDATAVIMAPSFTAPLLRACGQWDAPATLVTIETQWTTVLTDTTDCEDRELTETGRNTIADMARLLNPPEQDEPTAEQEQEQDDDALVGETEQ